MLIAVVSWLDHITEIIDEDRTEQMLINLNSGIREPLQSNNI